jgi:ATP-dependent RNA helicase RhlE
VEIKPEKTPMQIIEQSVLIVPREAKNATLTAYFRINEPERAIVFTRTKHGADRVATVLSRSGIPSGAIHGDKRQNARIKALFDFKNGRTRVLVATDIAARGIDVDGISHVINFDMPGDPETYVHRVGRTGRAGNSGKAVSLCQPEERRLVGAIERLSGRKIPVDRIDPALLAELPINLPPQNEEDFESFDDRAPAEGFRGGPRGDFDGPPGGGPGFGNRGRRPAGKGGPVKYGSRSGPARFGGGPGRPSGPGGPPRGRGGKGGPRKPARGGPR